MFYVFLESTSAFNSVGSFGLFSQPFPQESRPLSFIADPSSTKQSSTFTPRQLFSTQRHSFTPERPVSPVITSFGTPPFPNVPQESDRLSQCSSLSLRNISITRKREAVAKRQVSDAKQPEAVAREQNFVARQRVFTPVSRRRLGEDSDDDDMSDFTSVTNRCPVDSTTDVKLPPAKTGGFACWHY